MDQWGPLQRKHGPTSVPADHFAPWRNRHAAIDHQGRITALVADGPDPTPAPQLVPAEGFEPPTEGEEFELRQILIAAFDTVAERAADLPFPEPLEAYATWQLEHVALELGLFDEGSVLAEHEAKTVTHSHEHSAMGDQGDDATHTHQHSHSGDASHNHAHDNDGDEDDMGTAKPEPRTKITPVGPGELSEKIAELRARHKAQTPGTSRMTVRAFKRGDQLPLDDEHPGDPTAGVEVELAVKLDEETGTLVASAASGDYDMVAAGAEVPQIVDNPGAPWHAYLCVEGIRTDEWPSRELMPGGGQIPDLPVSMRFLVEDEGGHWGAITCGRIDTMERREVEGYQVFYAEGVFGTDENSQVSQLHVEEQTQRFVSIDPRDVDCEIVEVEISVSTGGGMFDDVETDNTVDAWVRYNSYVIGAATIVATPAIQQAVITMASEDLPWSAVAAERAPASPIIASAAADSDRAPAEWFDNPGFHVGDPRLVRQRDGKYACPLTLTDDGRVYGHVAYWGAKHTGFAQRDVTPPHSPTYAYFETGAYRTAEGTEVPVGQITMGCGHASTSENYMAAKAHYDGGYGAVQMADVRAGEDDFGIWVAGSLRPPKSADNPQGPTPDQVAQFRALGLSGDWRKIAGRAHFAAVLAVPVPGFPIAREALVASGAEEIDARAVRAGLDSEGEITSLVAAGRVHRLPPEEQLANLQHQVDTLLDERDERRQQEAKATALGRLRELTT